MSNIKYGEIDWADAKVKSNGENSRDLFLKLGPGSNVVRILTLPHQYYQHKYKVPGEKGYGHRINCSMANGSCEVCAKGDKAKRRWLLGVIDRKTGQYKVLDIGFSVFKGIQTYAGDDDWGNPNGYDIDIVVDPNGGSTGYYTVIAKPKKPLSVDDIQKKEANDPEKLVSLSTPPKPEKVSEKLQKIMETLTTAEGGESTSGLPSAMSESDDEEFTDFDKQKERKAPF